MVHIVLQGKKKGGKKGGKKVGDGYKNS